MRPFLAIFFTFGFAAGTAETVTFDSSRLGLIPDGWSVSSTNQRHPARWQIQKDETAPSRPYVLAQIATRSGSQDYSVALFDKSSCKDGEVSVDLKLLSGKMEQSAGVVWRFQDTANYYFALASADRDSVGVYKTVGSTVSLVAHAVVPHRIDDHAWNLLKVVFRGPRYTVYFGHRKLIDVQDSTFVKSGKTGVWTKADTVAYFDNFRLDKKN